MIQIYVKTGAYALAGVCTYNILAAAQNGFIITLNINKFGEGRIEAFMVLLWLWLAVFLDIKKLHEQRTEEYNERKRKELAY